MTTKTKTRKVKEVISLPECTSDDPNNHQGDTCPIHEQEELLYTVELPEGVELETPVEPYVPKMFEVYQLPKDGTEHVPDGPNPFYLISKDGLFLHRKFLIGRGLIPQTVMPKTLKGLDDEDTGGVFWWNAPKISAEICAQIVSFFRRIYETKHAEAEVILLLNYKTSEWGIHIPTQQVSHTGVKSVYEPSEIPADFVVVGTMHSHCDFGAFHSSTDTTDASDFDGVHLTIGHITRDMPEIAAMVMVNKKQFNYKHEQVADFSDLNIATAPEEWDEYVTVNTYLASGHKPKGYELFDKYKTTKPTAVTVYTPPKTQTPNYSKYPYPSAEHRPTYNTYRSWDNDDYDDDWKLWDEYFDAKYPKVDNETEDITKKYDADYWEEGLPENITDAIIESITIQETDIDYVMSNFMAGISIIHWRNLYLRKMADVVKVLSALNLEVNYQVRPKKVKIGDTK